MDLGSYFRWLFLVKEVYELISNFEEIYSHLICIIVNGKV